MSFRRRSFSRGTGVNSQALQLDAQNAAASVTGVGAQGGVGESGQASNPSEQAVLRKPTTGCLEPLETSDASSM